jgi:hypothetical protein
MSDTGRFGDERPQWPSLRGDAAGTTSPGGTGATVPTPATPATPAPAPAPARRARRYAAADGTAPDAPVDPAARTEALARADAALAAGDAGARASALARADAALAASAAPGPAEPRRDADADADAADGPPARGRRRAVLVASVVAAVLVLGGGGAYLLTRDGGGGTAAAPPDVVLPSPTATAAPAGRAATTPFATALPATLLQYALQESAADPEWLGQDAVEAYAETYTDGADGTVTVRAGQWETPEEAAAVLATVTAGLPAAPPAEDAAATDPAATPDPSASAAAPAVLLTGEVLVDGQPTGTVTVVDAGDGTGVAAWSNGTTVFRVTGPAADIANLYAAYPL